MGRRAKELDPLTDAQRSLAASFHGRALAMAASYGRFLPYTFHDDVRSAAGLGCVYAAATWDQLRGDFEPHAFQHVRCKILDVLRSAKRQIGRRLEWTANTESHAYWWW